MTEHVSPACGKHVACYMHPNFSIDVIQRYTTGYPSFFCPMLITMAGSIVQYVLVLVTTTHWYYTSQLAVFRLRADGPKAKFTHCEFISNVVVHLSQWIPSWICFSLLSGSSARGTALQLSSPDDRRKI